MVGGQQNVLILYLSIIESMAWGSNLSKSKTKVAPSIIHTEYILPQAVLAHPVSATVQCIPSGSI